ncbi:tryptophan halogenase family protein [Kutzneria sp. 744]|uniref:Tryptophan 7-halogenase KtzQ n=1 Tax=Kutzneria sp. (strain 744) TaxID=345341 RepID=TRP7H_KUTS7|nr:tryptophan halogenase family protein [Kutzneria sp. 744]A8CF75.1 RecName: Full=Tryptophan 7-halogenase KtzQ [Kutzneria sp. 744]ABV56597.1 KtzQ [Kutzneria sp. 744]EWM18621.1 tryptophan halogenase PrnA [Kutzneria sp. 744]
MDDNRIRSILVLGGGTAGWMSACYLSKALGPGVEVTVLEAPSISRIRVGEATIPNLHKVFFDFLGIAEDEWMRECNASYKAAVRFVNWRTPGDGQATPRRRPDGRPDHFDHLFGQLPEHENLPLSQYWAHRRLNGLTDEPFDRSCYVQPELLDRKLSPRLMDGTKLASYAWHFDADLVADFLCRFAVQKLNVTHVQDVFTHADLDQRGHITAVNTESGRTLAADLFIDCSGFRSVLMGKVMQEPFLDMSKHLLNDRAVALMLPHDDEKVGIEPYTSSLAMRSGWSWKIPLLGRFGSGYVYSSQFTSQDEAAEELCRMWDVDPAEQTFNNVRFRVGRSRRAWVRNCVAIGVSAMFVEPLESTGLYFSYASLYQLVKHFPDKRFRPILADRFNREVATMYDDTRDFLQAHFSLSPRDDSEFWRACKELPFADGFAEKVEMYRAGLPVELPVTIDDGHYYGNFEAEFRNFWTNSNYYCIFAGLGFLPEHPLPVLEFRPEAVDRAEPVFAAVRRRTEELVATAPTMQAYLRRLHQGT